VLRTTSAAQIEKYLSMVSSVEIDHVHRDRCRRRMLECRLEDFAGTLD